MFIQRTRRLLSTVSRVPTSYLGTMSIGKDDLSHMSSLLPKQLGNIALDVSRCANGDIRVWKAFVDSCTSKVESFDRKDILRIWKGLTSFYRNYSFKIREDDKVLIEKMLGVSYTMCHGHTCDDLSHLAESVSSFGLVNCEFTTMTTTLFSKIAVLFNIRLAEAIPSDVVKLLVAFSRLGITDTRLFDALSCFICNSVEFTAKDLRNVLVSYALLGYRNTELLEYATNYFLTLSDIGAKELAVLSFVYSSLDYRTDEVRSLFQRHVANKTVFPEMVEFSTNDQIVDLPTFYYFLDRIGVTIPSNIISLIDINQLNKDGFFKVVHLLTANSGLKVKIMSKYNEYENKGTLEDYVNVLKYVVNSGFEEKKFFINLCNNIATMGKQMQTSDHTSIQENDTLLERLQDTNMRDRINCLRNTNSMPFTSYMDSCMLSDLDETEDTRNEEGTIHTLVKTLRLVPAAWLSECTMLYDFLSTLIPTKGFYTDYTIVMSKGLVDENKQLEAHLESVANHYGTDLVSLIGDELTRTAVCRSPGILCAELSHYLGNHAVVPFTVDSLTLSALLKDHNTVVLPLYPEDFVRLKRPPLETREAWSPQMCLARADVYAAIYYIHQHGFRVAPMTSSLSSYANDHGSSVLEGLLSKSF